MTPAGKKIIEYIEAHGGSMRARADLTAACAKLVKDGYLTVTYAGPKKSLVTYHCTAKQYIEVSLPAFYQMLRGHDWYHDYSEDNGVRRRGQESLARLTEIAKQSPRHAAMFRKYPNVKEPKG